MRLSQKFTITPPDQSVVLKNMFLSFQPKQMLWRTQKNPGFYIKLNVWGSLGLNFEYDGGPIIEIGGPIFLYKLRILEGSTSCREGSVYLCCPQVSNFEGHVWPPSDFFGGPFEIFEGHILRSVNHNPICCFLQKLNLSL